MSALASLGGADRRVAKAIPALLGLTLLIAAAQAHLLCSVFCIHHALGTEGSMVSGPICGRAPAP